MTRMLMNAMNMTMGRGTSATNAGAAFSCPQTSSNNTIMLILDAIVMASIIICALLCTLLGLVSVFSLLGLVILAVLVRLVYTYLPRKRMRA